MNRPLGFWLATLLVFSGGMLIWFVAGANHERPPAALVPLSQPRMDEFELVDQTGAKFNSKSLRGKVWTGSFFFAACPSTCYQQNMKLQQLHAKYAEQGLEIVSITCDPANDTPVTLAGYASRFNANPISWKFLTPLGADMSYIRRIANDFFGVAVAAESHTDRVVLFDRDGKILGAYSVLKADQFRELDRQVGELLTTDSDGSSGEADQDASASSSAAGEKPMLPLLTALSTGTTE